MSLTFLHTNDFHGALTLEKARFIRSLKTCDTLYFDSGDCIKTGNLAIPLKQDQAWELLAEADCDASVLGNRETHILASAFNAKIAGHRHPILCANLRAKGGAKPLPSFIFLDAAGLKVGVFGVMVPMVTERMAARAASAFLWVSPLLIAREIVSELRGQVDCLIALTHIGHKQDRELAALCPEIDVILGGHSHNVLNPPVAIGDTYICQGGSHGRFVGRYIWNARGQMTGELVPLP